MTHLLHLKPSTGIGVSRTRVAISLGRALTQIVQQLIYTSQRRKLNLTNLSCDSVLGCLLMSLVQAVDRTRSLRSPFTHIFYSAYLFSRFLFCWVSLRFLSFCRHPFFPVCNARRSSVNNTHLFVPVCCDKCTYSSIILCG